MEGKTLLGFSAMAPDAGSSNAYVSDASSTNASASNAGKVHNRGLGPIQK